MKVTVLNESSMNWCDRLDKRCALTPQTAGRLIKLGMDVVMQSGAGVAAGYADSEYAEAGVTCIEELTDALRSSDILLCVNKPNQDAVSLLKSGAVVIGHLDPFFNQSFVEFTAKQGVTAISVEMIPRTSRAQKMDALSSQASLAGYVMVMQAATHLPSILPMMMTPSGTIKPAKVFVIGAGVAGLQAIATAKRLGASVLAYDTREVVAEQVESLGAKFLYIDIGETGQTKDGYAKALTDAQRQMLQDAQKEAIASSDIVITTAQLFGRKPPVLIQSDTLALMKPGSVVVDMAAQNGGNVEGSSPGEITVINGVTVIGTGDWSQSVAKAATDMYANNVFNLVTEFYHSETQSFEVSLDDDILKGCVIAFNGSIINDMLLNAYAGD